MINMTGRLQYDQPRGVLYFFDDKTGVCLLRIEGIPQGIPDGNQIDIHLAHPGNEHHHEHCGQRQILKKGVTRDEGVVCAVKLRA
jgi:hypothetical protein